MLKSRERVVTGFAVQNSLQRTFGNCGLLKHLLATGARSTLYAAAIGVALVIVVAIPLAMTLNIWIDEAFTMHSTGAGVAYAWREAIEFEAQPPLYFVLEAAWRTLNETSILFARIPSAVFAATAVAAMVWAAHRIVPQVPPFVVALVTASNPLVIWAATEMRVYALLFLVGTVLTWSYYEGFLVSRMSRAARIWYVLFAICGLYTQYYVGFFLVAQGIGLLATRRLALRGFATAMAAVAVAFLPFLPTALKQIRASRGRFLEPEQFSHIAHEIVNNVFVYVLPHQIEWFGVAKIAGFFLAATVFLGLPAFGRPEFDGPRRGILLQWLIGLVVFALLFSVTGVPPLIARHIIVIAPSSMLAAFIVVASLTRRRQLGAIMALATFATFTISTLWIDYRPPVAKTGDWRRVAATLATETQVPIAVFPAELALPLNVYLPTPLIPIPRPLPFRADYVALTSLTAEREVARVLDPVRARSERLWLVSYGACGHEKIAFYDYHCRYLKDYLDHHYRVLRTVEFDGARARLYARTQEILRAAPARENAN